MSTTATTRIGLAVALFLGTAMLQPATARTTDLRAYSCAMYLAADAAERIAVSSWLQGYLAHRYANRVIDTQTLADTVITMTAWCEVAPPDFMVAGLFGLMHEGEASLL